MNVLVVMPDGMQGIYSGKDVWFVVGDNRTLHVLSRQTDNKAEIDTIAAYNCDMWVRAVVYEDVPQ